VGKYVTTFRSVTSIGISCHWRCEFRGSAG